jgi:hypothetical protein
MSKAEPRCSLQALARYTILQVRDVIPWTNLMNVPQARLKRRRDPAPGCHVNRRINNITIVYVWSNQRLDKPFPHGKWRMGGMWSNRPQN